MKRKLINIFVCCTISICSKAQTEGFKYYAQLDSIKTSEFYNIALTPTLNAHLKTDYSDIRIINLASKWVPHALHAPAYEISGTAANVELKYEQIENNKTNTTLILNAVTALKNIEITIRNTAAERYCSLSGSDDNKNWFVINDSILISPIPTETKSINTFEINFPLNNYKYYKLNIKNSNKDPYEINKITSNSLIIESEKIKNKIIKNPTPSIFQKDSGKISYIKVMQQHPYHFDGFYLKLSGVKYYSRNIDFFIPTNTNHSFSNPGKLLQSYTIFNNSNLNFQLPLIKDSVFYLLINNEDNLPLKVNEAGTSLNERFITAYLEKDNQYKLIWGNENATAPIYDIEKLNIKLKDSATYLNINNIEVFPQQTIADTKNNSNNKWIIWVALVAGLSILLILTKKMIKEVDKKTTDDTI
jgi:hypothetical protein